MLVIKFQKERITTMLLIILCLFHLLSNIIWFSNFEPSLDLITKNTEEKTYLCRSSEPVCLPRIFAPEKTNKFSSYQISLILFSLVKFLPGHFAFINTLLFLFLIITVFLIGKKMENRQLGLNAAFLVSFSPIIYFLSRQINFFLFNIFIVSFIILLLLYSNFFSKISLSISAAFLTLSMKYFLPASEIILSYLALSGPLIYLTSGMLKRLAQNIQKDPLRVSQTVASFILFVIILFIDFKSTLFAHLSSDYLLQEHKRYSQLNAWYQVGKIEKKVALFIELNDQALLHLEMEGNTSIAPLKKAIDSIKLPDLREPGTIIPEAGQSKNSWKQLRRYFPKDIAGRPLKNLRKEIYLDNNKKIKALEINAFYDKQGLIKASIYLNRPARQKSYLAIKNKGEVETNTLANHRIVIKGSDILSNPQVALAAYWFIIAFSLLRPVLFSVFLIFFILYFRKSFAGKWLLISWLFIPIITLTLISKKTDWYIISTLPAFALLTGHFLAIFRNQINKKLTPKFLLCFIISILTLDFFYLSFFAEKIPNYKKLSNSFYRNDILPSFDALMENKFTVHNKAEQRAKKIIAEIKNNKDIQRINILNDYQLFQELSFYASLKKKLVLEFRYIEDKNKKNSYEMVSKGKIDIAR